MTITGQNFDTFQGNVKHLRVTNYDGDGNILDLTGAQTITWFMYHPTTKQVYITKSLDDGIEILSPETNGVIIITLNPEDTTNLLGRYNHECELVDSIGDVSTLFTGTGTVIYTRA